MISSAASQQSRPESTKAATAASNVHTAHAAAASISSSAGTSTAAASTTVATGPKPEAAKQIQEGLSKATTHEAVGYRIAAG